MAKHRAGKAGIEGKENRISTDSKCCFHLYKHAVTVLPLAKRRMIKTQTFWVWKDIEVLVVVKESWGRCEGSRSLICSVGMGWRVTAPTQLHDEINHFQIRNTVFYEDYLNVAPTLPISILLYSCSNSTLSSSNIPSTIFGPNSLRIRQRRSPSGKYNVEMAQVTLGARFKLEVCLITGAEVRDISKWTISQFHRDRIVDTSIGNSFQEGPGAYSRLIILATCPTFTEIPIVYTLENATFVS